MTPNDVILGDNVQKYICKKAHFTFYTLSLLIATAFNINHVTHNPDKWMRKLYAVRNDVFYLIYYQPTSKPGMERETSMKLTSVHCELFQNMSSIRSDNHVTCNDHKDRNRNLIWTQHARINLPVAGNPVTNRNWLNQHRNKVMVRKLRLNYTVGNNYSSIQMN